MWSTEPRRCFPRQNPAAITSWITDNVWMKCCRDGSTREILVSEPVPHDASGAISQAKSTAKSVASQCTSIGKNSKTQNGDHVDRFWTFRSVLWTATNCEQLCIARWTSRQS